MRILRYYGTDSASVPSLMMPAFQNLMNDMSTVPVLGTGFNVYAPLVLVILCAFTYYKVRMWSLISRGLVCACTFFCRCVWSIFVFSADRANQPPGIR